MSDFSDFFWRAVQCFKQFQIDYVVVGGTIMPHYGHIRTTTDIDIMIIIDSLMNIEIQSFLRCLKSSQISINFEEFMEMMKTRIHISAFDEKTWIYRLDLKIVETPIDRITIKHRRETEIYGVDTFIACPETMIAIKISDGYQSDNDIEDILSIIEFNKIDIDLLKESLSSINATFNFKQFLEQCELPICKKILQQM